MSPDSHPDSVPASKIGSIGFCAHSVYLEERGTRIDGDAQARMKDGTDKHLRMARFGDVQQLAFRLGIGTLLLFAALGGLYWFLVR